jgi:hypothetical protein
LFDNTSQIKAIALSHRIWWYLEPQNPEALFIILGKDFPKGKIAKFIHVSYSLCDVLMDKLF